MAFMLVASYTCIIQALTTKSIFAPQLRQRSQKENQHPETTKYMSNYLKRETCIFHLFLFHMYFGKKWHHHSSVEKVEDTSIITGFFLHKVIDISRADSNSLRKRFESPLIDRLSQVFEKAEILLRVVPKNKKEADLYEQQVVTWKLTIVSSCGDQSIGVMSCPPASYMFIAR